MSRLIVVSNRVGDFKSGFHAGGLSVALCEVLGDRGGIWFGTSERPARGSAAEFQIAAPGVQVASVPIGKEDYNAFYFGYANALLWPICHNRIDLAHFDNVSYESYRDVNRLIARAIQSRLQPDDILWIHDYHLIPLGQELRKLGVRNPMGFFLHIPFPPGDVFAALPQHDELVMALGHYDLVGFQTQKDVASFLHYVQRHHSANILSSGAIRLKSLYFHCASFPIGIDAAQFAAAARAREARARRPADDGMAHLIGVDRLDYSKGLIQRFRAFARFLELHPHRHGSVTYTQIAPPTRVGLRAYSHIRDELEQLAGSINGRFGGLDWMPIHYIHRAYPRPALARLYRRARLGLVTPTQDGMNLVAKEYVAAQDPDDPGVLILSKFAGAAEQLKAALIVNPHDEDECARAMEAGLVMPLDERRDRYRQMAGIVFERDVHAWSRDFLHALDRSSRERLSLEVHPLPRRDFRIQGPSGQLTAVS